MNPEKYIALAPPLTEREVETKLSRLRTPFLQERMHLTMPAREFYLDDGAPLQGSALLRPGQFELVLILANRESYSGHYILLLSRGTNGEALLFDSLTLPLLSVYHDLEQRLGHVYAHPLAHKHWNTCGPWCVAAAKVLTTLPDLDDDAMYFCRRLSQCVSRDVVSMDSANLLVLREFANPYPQPLLEGLEKI
jgi:hypothetical protein